MAGQAQPPISDGTRGGYNPAAGTLSDSPAAPGYNSSSRAAAVGRQSIGTPASNALPLAMEGYCPVSLAEKERWVKGDPRYGVNHQGKTYLFVGPREADRFFTDPERFAPVMSGMDVVLAVDENRQVPGRREFGAWYPRYQGRVFLLSSEATYQKFAQDPARYAAAAAQRSANSMARRGPTPPAAAVQNRTPSYPGGAAAPRY